MIDLYTAPTPNGRKVSIMLEELAVPYRVIALNLGADEQKSPEFLALNPNGRIPVIVDREAGDFVVIESGAILWYLGEKHGRLIGDDPQQSSEVLQWLMFQMGGLGPMMGQANVFYRYFPEKIPAAIDRYQHEGRRLLSVLNTRLQGRDYLCDTYSVADIANWCWAARHEWSGISLEGLDDLQVWMERIAQREAVQRGSHVPDIHVSKEQTLDAGRRIVVT